LQLVLRDQYYREVDNPQTVFEYLKRGWRCRDLWFGRRGGRGG